METTMRLVVIDFPPESEVFGADGEKLTPVSFEQATQTLRNGGTIPNDPWEKIWAAYKEKKAQADQEATRKAEEERKAKKEKDRRDAIESWIKALRDSGWHKPTPSEPVIIDDIKPEITDEQWRARHREAVTRAMAIVDKALADLPEEPSAIQRALRQSTAFWSGLSARELLNAFLSTHIAYGVPEPLPRPDTRVTWAYEIRIHSGGFRGNVPLGANLIAYLDKFGDMRF